ncbi:MAG: J domain-containing protein [Candidatus Micrarchaeia archaeon]
MHIFGIFNRNGYRDFADRVSSIVERFNHLAKKFSIDTDYKYFKILGIEPTDNKDTIKEAYRNIIKRYHPDINKTNDAHIITEKANEAYHALVGKNVLDKADKRIENTMLNLLIREYNALLEKDLKKLKEDFSHGRVEKWFFEQEMDEFLNYKKRANSAFKNVFKDFMKFKKEVHKLNKTGMHIKAKRRIDISNEFYNALIEIGSIDKQCQVLYNNIRSVKKRFYAEAQKSNREMKARIKV